MAAEAAAAGAAPVAVAVAPVEGSRVLARYRGSGPWFLATVAGVTPAGRFAVNYQDGDRESGLPLAAVVPVPVGTEGAEGRWAVGTPVVVPTHPGAGDRGPFVLGVVTRVDPEARAYDVQLEGGGVAQGLPAALVLAQPPGLAAAFAAPAQGRTATVVDPGEGWSLASDVGGALSVGAPVSARWRAGSSWYPGRVTAATGDGPEALYGKAQPLLMRVSGPRPTPMRARS